MRCPTCGGDLRSEVLRCPDCREPLVQFPGDPVRSARSPGEISVVVLRTADPAALALATSLLEEEGISFAVRNERMIGLFPSALSGPALDAKYRAAEIEVLESDLSSARSLLVEVEGVIEERP